MLKYELIPQQLVYEGIVSSENFFSANKIEEYWLRKAHDLDYIKKLNTLSLSKSEIRKTCNFSYPKRYINTLKQIVGSSKGS